MWRITIIKETIKDFLKFVKWLPTYYWLHKCYGYEPSVYMHIVDNYEMVLTSRTKTMSKPTYHWKDVVREIDNWYEDKD